MKLKYYLRGLGIGIVVELVGLIAAAGGGSHGVIGISGPADDLVAQAQRVHALNHGGSHAHNAHFGFFGGLGHGKAHAAQQQDQSHDEAGNFGEALHDIFSFEFYLYAVWRISTF